MPNYRSKVDTDVLLEHPGPPGVSAPFTVPATVLKVNLVGPPHLARPSHNYNRAVGGQPIPYCSLQQFSIMSEGFLSVLHVSLQSLPTGDFPITQAMRGSHGNLIKDALGNVVLQTSVESVRLFETQVIVQECPVLPLSANDIRQVSLPQKILFVVPSDVSVPLFRGDFKYLCLGHEFVRKHLQPSPNRPQFIRTAKGKKLEYTLTAINSKTFCRPPSAIALSTP